jgi:hypothetical protein
MVMGVLGDLAMGRARFGLAAALALAGAAEASAASAPPAPARPTAGVVHVGVEADPALMAAVSAALVAAATVPDARIEGLSVDRPRNACGAAVPERVEIPRPVDGSARLAVKLIGPARGAAPPCETWGWARFRLLAPVPVAGRAVRAGEPLAGATRLDEREIKAGHPPADLASLEAGATADRTLVPGQMVEADMVRAPGPRPGDPVKVVLVAGALAIEQTGRSVPCARNHNCAVLPSGKHVDGAFVDGRLLVQMP